MMVRMIVGVTLDQMELDAGTGSKGVRP